MGKRIIVIGAGAAGIFAAANAAKINPGNNVTVLEKSSKLLSKVKVSGGGRCNVTNSCKEVGELVKNYPRGGKELVTPFSKFGTIETRNWFFKNGVELKTEPDGRMFPITDNSQTIINCLLNECSKHRVNIKTNTHIKQIAKSRGCFELSTVDGETIECDKLLIAAGGNSKAEAYQYLKQLGHSIETPVPSLFTFNLESNLAPLAGISVPLAQVKIAGTKLVQKGPLLITHWGLSGPAVLKLSAWGARALFEKNYKYTILINWLCDQNEQEVRQQLESFKALHPLKKVSGATPFELPRRLWEFFTLRAEINPELKWNNLSGKSFNKLVNGLVCDEYTALGKTTYKEEFVTCGGVKLEEVNMLTMESKICPGLYFAGEVLDIDGITGGFNFQAAWTTGWLSAQHMAG